MTKTNKTKSYTTNIYAALLLYLLLVMLFYSLCRIGFYLFNTSYFPGMTLQNFADIMWGGLQFDLAAVLYTNALLILLLIIPNPWQYNSKYKAVCKWVFIVVNSLAIATNVIDFIYYKFTLRRTTLSIFSQFKNENNLGVLFIHFFFTYWYAVLLFVVLIFLLVKMYKWIDYERIQTNNRKHYLISILLVPVVVVLFVGGVRGGFAHSTRPITLSNAAQYGNDPRDMNIVLNTPFAMIRTVNKYVIKKMAYFPDDQLVKIFTPLHIPTDTAKLKYDNVVVIILESFSKEFISIYNKNKPGYKGYAPFMDSLIGKSRAFQYSFANGRKSIEAMPSILCSIPSIELPYVLSQYSGDKVNGLASLLKEKGYYTSFFHGAPNGSMGFLAFSKTTGFDDYFGKNEYNNDKDFDGMWAIWDEPFLQFFAHKINTFKQPFFTTIFTASSHDPYIIPEQYKNVFKGGPLAVNKGIQYTDYSLKRFFETAKTMPWFKNTLFVFTADHASPLTYYPEYSSLPGYFSIPVFFYKEDENWAYYKDEVIDQIDIIPTVLGYLHYDKPYVAFGRNVFAENTTPYAFNYLNNTYNLFYGDYVLMYQNEKPIALYNFKTDFTQQHNLLIQLPDT
ncbi:MAG: LTA synthase family protein, partial [Bacteroidota bacterium]|nr:LTA synthase family protein [Bacteroidota bacterium]